MDSFEWNKIFGGVLGSLLVVLGVGKVVGAVYHPEPLEKNAYVVEGVAPHGEGGETKTAEAVAAVPLPNLLASAKPEAGAKVAKVCVSCHTFEQGGPNKTGPNLFGVVGNHLAHKDDFKYSAAFQTEQASGKTWTYDALFAYLDNPKAYLPGNMMSFAGVKNLQQRADLIAYLKSISPDAPPLPAVSDAPAPPAAPH